MVLGPSGAGKSTLMRGVLGLWRTTSGEIRIDGAEAASYDRVQLGPQIGYLPQSIELLDGTVSSNIARFGEVCSDSVVLAARDAGVHNFILSLPSGYDTVIGMGGGILSPGQRQRVALARALYKRPKLVVLDEPNSNLDTDGEQALNESIKILKEVGSTVVVVSHRQTVLPLVDHAIVMNDGVVADAGPISEVTDRLAQKYADLYPSDVGTRSRKKIRTLPTVVPVTPLPAPTHQD
jgi:ATP-binding cassette subfamily C protein EexD